MSCVTTPTHNTHNTLTHHTLTVVLADSDPPGWAISTSLIKTITILLIMLPLSLLRNIAMLEKVGVVCYLDNGCLVTKLQFSALAVLFVTAIVLFTVVKAATYYCSV